MPMRKADDKPHPYSHLSDTDLEDARASQLEGYIQRMHFFDSLPRSWHPRNVRDMYEHPEKYGATVAELDEWGRSVLEHWREASKLNATRDELRRRVKERAFKEVLNCATLSEANDKYSDVGKGTPATRDTSIQPGETIEQWVARVESEDMENARTHGIVHGLFEYRMRETGGGRWSKNPRRRKK